MFYNGMEGPPRVSGSSDESHDNGGGTRFTKRATTVFFIFIRGDPLGRDFEERAICGLGQCPAPRVISVCYNLFMFVSVFSQVFLVYAMAITVSPVSSVSRVLQGGSSFMGA